MVLRLLVVVSDNALTWAKTPSMAVLFPISERLSFHVLPILAANQFF